MEQLNTVKRSESIGHLASALAKFNKEIKNIHKSIDGAKGKNDSKARYKYFDIAQLLEHVRQPLADVGLSIMQFNINGENSSEVGCITMLMHESGEFIESPPTFAKIDNPVNQYGNKNMTDVQAYGSVISFIRRYSLASVIGLAGDKDDNDGARIESNYEDKKLEKYSSDNKNTYDTTVYKASEKQVGYLKSLLTNKGYTDDAKYSSLCMDLLGAKKKVAELTKTEAKAMIEALNSNQGGYVQ